MTRYALILSPLTDERPHGLDHPATDDIIVGAITASWCEVYDVNGDPVVVHEPAAAAILDDRQVKALIDSLFVGCDGIEGDDDRDEDAQTEAVVRGAAVALLKVVAP